MATKKTPTKRRRNPVKAHELYYQATRADAEFSRELERVYGKRKAADARYQTQTFTDAKLLAAYKNKLAADERLRAVWEAGRKTGQRRNPKPITSKKRYRAGIRQARRQGLTWKEFESTSDNNALRYAKGLLLRKFPKGSELVSLKVLGPSKKKVTRRRAT